MGIAYSANMCMDYNLCMSSICGEPSKIIQSKSDLSSNNNFGKINPRHKLYVSLTYLI